MNEPKPFASLGPTLLARKGGARPAMRPQLAPLTGMGAEPFETNAEIDPEALEDLGWNDMGHEDLGSAETPVLSLTPAPANPFTEAEARADDAAARAALEGIASVEPEVRRQQRTLSEALPAERPTKVRRSAVSDGRRAAFTLRLDARRHLKLRLASTVKNRSAQQLVTQALDKYLAEIPEIEALAAQVKPN
jgi:hypothetical protein